MTEQNPLLATLGATLDQLRAAGVPLGGAVPSAVPKVENVLVPVEMQTPQGAVTVQLVFGPEHGQSSAALMTLVQQLQASGVPVRAFVPRQFGRGFGGRGVHRNGFGGWNGGNGGGSWGGW